MNTPWRLGLLGTGMLLALAGLDWWFARGRDTTGAVFAALRAAHALTAPAGACKSHPTRDPAQLVLITARQCMSCRDVGLLLREIQRHHRPDLGERLELAVTAEDTAVVCDFLKSERIPLAVRVLSARDAETLTDSAPIGYARFNGSTLADSIAAPDGLSLLALIRMKPVPTGDR